MWSKSFIFCLVLILLVGPVSILPCRPQSNLVCAAIAAEGADKTLSSEELVERANEAFYARQIKQARALCQQALESYCDENHISESQSTNTHINAQTARFLLNRSACDIELKDDATAQKTIASVEKYLRNPKNQIEKSALPADCLLLRGELAYRSGDSKNALPCYSQALHRYIDVFGADSAALSQPLEGMAACLRQEGHLGRALSAERQAALNDFINMGLDSFRFCETLKFVVQMEQEAGNKERAEVIQDLLVTSLRAGMGRRLERRFQEKALNGEIKSDELAAIQSRIERVVIGKISQADVKERVEKIIGVPRDILDQPEGKPQVMDFDSWIYCRKALDLPAMLFLINPQVPQKALVYCIHGLGLQGASFRKFGQSLADLGYPVLMPDIRGFGANASHKGLDLLEPEDSLNDIHRNLLSLKRSNPDMPVILLGESMGGALALQSAARHSDLVSGLICSVPSGARFGGLADGLRVARGLLEGQKQIDVGKMIVHRAVSDQESRKRWQSDPNARLSLSPRELLKFQEFMDQNEKAAKNLVKMPVLFLQGERDGLVKPMGTAELYNTVVSRDKDYFVVGMEEHLIFEDENFPSWIPSALSAWLEAKLIGADKFQPR